MKKLLILIMLLLVIEIPLAFAGDITFSLDQTEYYFQTGEKAIVPLKVKNTYGKSIAGALSYTTSRTVNQAGVHYSSSNTQSTSMSVEDGEKTVELGFGTSDTPLTLKVSLNFFYRDRDLRVVKLDDIIIHFVSEKSQKKNQKNPTKSSSQKAAGGSSSRGADPFDRMDRMEKEMNKMMRRQEQRLNRMFNNPMSQTPRQRMSPKQRMQNSQMPQDSQALRKQLTR